MARAVANDKCERLRCACARVLRLRAAPHRGAMGEARMELVVWRLTRTRAARDGTRVSIPGAAICTRLYAARQALGDADRRTPDPAGPVAAGRRRAKRRFCLNAR
jgi:hypothetical protein